MNPNDWPAISIVFPTWQRAKYFERTMGTIKKQEYPGPLEIIVVQSGRDDEMRETAFHWDAKYIEAPRDSYPEFQNIAECWNMCFAASTADVIIAQCAEIEYQNPHSITSLVQEVLSGNKILATSLVKDLNEEGEMTNWQNHPKEGSRPGWISGSGPHAFRRHEMMFHGGYDTRFYGYGHEDDFFFYTLRKQGWDIRYVEQSVCAHRWHPRLRYEPVTGYANRALIRILYTEIEEGLRMPVPNRQEVIIDRDTTEGFVTAVALMADRDYKVGKTYHEWFKRWAGGDHRADETFVAQRIMANEPDKLGEMVTEAAWAIVRAQEAHEESVRAEERGMTDWARRCARCTDLQQTWAARALHQVVKLMSEQKVAT